MKCSGSRFAFWLLPLQLLLLLAVGGSDAFHVPSTTVVPNQYYPARPIFLDVALLNPKPSAANRRSLSPTGSAGLRTSRNSMAIDETDQLLPNKINDTEQQETISSSNITTTTTSNNDSPITTTTSKSASYPQAPTFRECLAFVIPALGIYACPPLMSLIDASFIGRSSSLELAALGPASSISDSAPLPLLFLSIASTNLIAKAFSQNDQASLARVSRTALGMGASCGLVLAILLYAFASPISVLYCGGAGGVAALLAPPCSQYVAIRALALPFVVLTTIAQAISIGTKDTKTPMAAVAMAGGLNLMGDLILVKWLGQGIAGAAWATAASQILAAGLLLRVLKKRGFLNKHEGVEPETIHKDERNSNSKNEVSTNTTTTTTMATIKQLLSFIPFLFVMTVKIGWHNSCAATAASLGGAQAAAHTALLSVAMVCFLLGDAGSSLAQAFLPAFIKNKQVAQGEGGVTSPTETTTFDLEAAMPTIKQLLKCTLSISTAAVGLSSLLIGVLGHQITSDIHVLAEMKKTLPWIVTALAFHGSAVTLEGLLLVRKKFRSLSVCYTILAMTVAAFQFATKRFSLGLAGVWACYVWFCASRVITFSSLGGILPSPRRWFQKRRIVSSSTPTASTTTN